MTTSLSLSPALPESVVCVVDGDDDDCCVCVDYDDYGKTRVCVTDALGFHDQKNKNYELYEHKITAHMTPYTTHVPFRLLPASTSPTAPFPLIHSPRTALASTWDDAYDADEEFYESDNQRQGTSLSSTFPSLITTTTTTVTATTTITTATATATAISTSNVPNTLHRWPTKANMPTLRGRRSFLSSKVHSLLHPPSIDGHSSSLEDAPPRPPVPSFYTTATASSTEDDYTTGSEDFFATSPESLRLHEHDSYLLDDDPDPFANYLSRARSSSSINSSHLDHTHPHAAQTHPLTATATATAAPTQPKPFLTRIPTFTSRARRRLSMTGPPTPNGSIRRQRLFTRPSLPSLVSLAQKLGTNLPTTNEDSDPDFPIPLLPSLNSSSQPVGHRLYGSSVDPSKDPDGAVAPMSRSSPSLIGRGGRSILVDTNTDVQYLPVVGTNNSNASLNIYPHLLFPDDPNASVIRRPGAAESASFIAGSGSGNGSHQQCQQNHTPGSNQYSHSSYSGGGMGGGGGTGGGSGGGGGGGSGNRSDGDRSRRPRGQYKDYSSTDTHATTTEDERGTHSSRGGSGSGDSDDTPLAWRLPGALTAQKSLRRQVKEDRDMQRQVRARARAKSAPRSQVPTTTRPADGDRSESLSVDELTRKLLKVQVQSSSPSPVHNEQQQTSTSTSTYHKYAFTATPPHPHGPEAYPVNRRGSESSDRHYPHASPVARPNNTAQPNTMGNMTAFPPSPHPQQQPAPHNLQRAMTSATARSRPRSDRPSHEMPEQRQRTDTLVPPSRIRQRANTLSSPSSSRPSTSWTAAPASTAPVPPLPVAAHVPTLPGRGFAHAGEGGLTMLQRVFVGDMQRFSTVEIGHGTKARDVVALIDERGELPRDAKAGGWMLFELSNDFGMERPIREFEPVMEVYNSWNTDTRLNTFMLKKTPLAATLAPQNIPKASPKFGGYVEWEQKRGKWSKRWLELREHSLWVSKKEGAPARDSILICSLSNFDAYLVTRIHKAPKPFTFSVKSVDNLNLFERAADYHHVFSCSVGDGLIWLEKLLLARSYVLQQERAALFTNTQGSTSTPKSTSLSRAGTTKRGVPANGPFLSFDLAPRAPLITPPETTTFEPGSLLARRMAGEK